MLFIQVVRTVFLLLENSGGYSRLLVCPLVATNWKIHRRNNSTNVIQFGPVGVGIVRLICNFYDDSESENITISKLTIAKIDEQGLRN